MTEFPILTKRIRELWGYFAEIENLLYIGPSETPEIAVDNIKREIIKLQLYIKTLHEKNLHPLPPSS